MGNKRRILFVDDEKEILNGLRRILYSRREKWDMQFVISGKEALDMLSKGKFDVVVTDMRMPGMDGAELLTIIKEKHPDIVRIILSGHSEMSAVLKSVGPAHQYLAKPCDPEKLTNTIDNACSLRSFLSDKSLQRVITQLETLPSIPSLYIEIIEELNSEDGSINKIGEIISRDAGMSAKILQLVNSAFFGLVSRVSHPSQAVHMLGLEMVKALVLTVKIFSQFDKSIMKLFSVEYLWKHSLAVATCAKEIAIVTGMNKRIIEDSFMAGILHDIGIIVLAANLPEKYKEVMAIHKEEGVTWPEAENQVFGASHPEVGAYLLGLWGLPDEIIAPVFCHHFPISDNQYKNDPSTFIIVAETEVSKIIPATMPENIAIANTKRPVAIDETERKNLWLETCRKVINKISAEEI
jgi:HD-like signal output (HDOD) protein